MERDTKKQLARMAVEGLVFLAGAFGVSYSSIIRKPEESRRYSQLQQEIYALNSKREGIENYFSAQSLTNILGEYRLAIKSREDEMKQIEPIAEQYRNKQNKIFWISYGAMIMSIGSIFTSLKKTIKRKSH